MHHSYLSSVSFFLPLWLPQGSWLGMASVTDILMAAASFTYWYGRWHSLSTGLPLGHKFDQCLGGISWLILYHGRLISRLDKDSVDRPLNVLIFRSGLVDNLKFYGSPVLLVYYDVGNVFLCCFFPYLEWHYYNILCRVKYMINSLNMFKHHWFCQRSGYTLGNVRDTNLMKQDISNTVSNVNEVLVQQREVQGTNNLKITRESIVRQWLV